MSVQKQKETLPTKIRSWTLRVIVTAMICIVVVIFLDSFATWLLFSHRSAGKYIDIETSVITKQQAAYFLDPKQYEKPVLLTNRELEKITSGTNTPLYLVVSLKSNKGTGAFFMTLQCIINKNSTVEFSPSLNANKNLPNISIIPIPPGFKNTDEALYDKKPLVESRWLEFMTK